MRELISGDTIIRVRASNLALLYYQQEFGSDIVEATSAIYAKYINLVQSITGQKDVTKIDASKINYSSLDFSKLKLPGIDLLKIVWAMNKAQNTAESLQTPKFDEWLAKYDELKVSDIQQAALEEAADGFFR